ncbi:MAG TPA: FkbM family methyltransferase [Baekduia sp.]|uniref:FkbM family methyltransferase n=1 Tax=Baekduia sp. TaxID=2600305 RepID=UPI002D79B327|nr:FkbM family methyltransferase [Baekduia sp.]HET6507367.1 FkbM family methyltransferase [Baekduia sp.]
MNLGLGWARRFADRLRFARVRTPLKAEQRRQLLASLGVTVVIDGGANVGQYAIDELRQGSGWTGRIVSFEPVPTTFASLARRAKEDALWQVRCEGLGDAAGTVTCHVPRFASDMASVSELTPTARAIAGSQVVDQCDVVIVRLDQCDGVVESDDVIALKLDVQGHERFAIDGAAGVLEQIALIECEVAYEPLYEGQVPFVEQLGQMAECGFRPVGVYNNLMFRGGRIFDADVLLVRDRPSDAASSAEQSISCCGPG